jgi:hypothetical protein
MNILAVVIATLLIATTSALADLYPQRGDTCVTNDRAVFTMTRVDAERLLAIDLSGDQDARQAFFAEGRAALFPAGTEVLIVRVEGTSWWEVRPRGTTQTVWMQEYGFASCKQAEWRKPVSPEKPPKEKPPKR